MTKADRSQIEALYKSQVPDDVAAEQLGLKIGSLRKAQVRLGLRVPTTGGPLDHMDEPRIQRAKILLAERMPANWVAEDVGVRPDAIRRRFKPGHDADWQAVWPQIRRNDSLLALHRELAPRGTK